jgi:hypothetical protein
MLKPLRLAICLLVAPAVVASGCGSTETASTSSTTASTSSTASANAGTSAPKASAQTASQSTSSTAAPDTTKAHEPKAPEAKSKHPLEERVAELRRKLEHQAPKKRVEAAKPSAGLSQQQVPLKQRYAEEIQRNFTNLCKAGKGSASSCECLLVRLEVSNVEKGQSIAELLAVDEALQRGSSFQEIAQRHVRLPRRVQGDAEACKSA